MYRMMLTPFGEDWVIINYAIAHTMTALNSNFTESSCSVFSTNEMDIAVSYDNVHMDIGYTSSVFCFRFV